MVLVLMGIILSMMTISVGDGGQYRRLEEEANRLKTLMIMAKEEVVLRSQEWAIVFKQDGYQFEQEEVEEVEGTPKLKKTLITDKIFRPRELPGYHLSIIIEDIEYTDEFDEDREADEEDTIGRVQIYSSGEITEFELTLRLDEGDDHFVLKGMPSGELGLTSSRDDDL